MNESAAELEILVRLLDDRVRDALIQKISQPRDTVFVFDFYRAGHGRVRLLADLTPGAVRFHETALKLPNPDDAPSFCRLLRKLLRNGRARSLEILGGDRVAAMSVDRMTEGGLHRRRVVFELLPGRAALYVLDEDDVILAASAARSGGGRQLARGARWEPPPPPPAGVPAATPFARLGGWTDDDLAHRLDEEASALGTLETGLDLRALRKELSRTVKRQVKRVSKIEGDLRRAESGDELAAQGELLKSSLHDVHRGQTEARLRDWSAPSGEERWVTIPLDPTLTPQENMERLFRRAKKCIRGREMITTRLDEQRERLRALNRLEARLDDASGEELKDVEEEARALGLQVVRAAARPSRTMRAKPAPRKPYRVFHSKDGLEIRVGRTGRDNDELTFRHARGNEWWLHAQDHAGSHVVVKTDGELPEQTLLDAATLAVIYSKAASEGKQAVSYTRRKHVTKFKGAAPGKVALQTHRTVVVRMEPERIERLRSGGS